MTDLLAELSDGPGTLCSCCGVTRASKMPCLVCDLAVMVSPPHVCLRHQVVISDEFGSPPIFADLPEDHEIAARAHWDTP